MKKVAKVSPRIYREFLSIDRDCRSIELQLGGKIAVYERNGLTFDRAVDLAVDEFANQSELLQIRKILFLEKLQRMFGLQGEGNFKIDADYNLYELPGRDEWLPVGKEEAVVMA